MKTAVLVIDLINEFVTGRLGSPRVQSIIPNVENLLKKTRQNGTTIIYITDSHLPEIDPEFKLWGHHAVAGTESAKIIPELKPENGDHHLLKRHYSAFYATGLDALLRELKITHVILTGVLTNICIQHTAADAYFRQYKIIVPTDCVEALTDEEQENCLEYMKQMYNVNMTTSSEIISIKFEREE